MDPSDRERWQAVEDVAQPSEGVEAVGAVGFDEGVKDSGAIPGFGFIGLELSNSNEMRILSL